VPDSGGPLQIALPDQGLVLHLGERETLLLPDVLPDMRNFPDLGTVVLQRSPVRALMASGNFPLATRLVTGADWRHLTEARTVLTAGGPESFDNNVVAITGVYRHVDRRLFAVYYAEDNLRPGFYASQGLAVSSDEGNSWTKLGQIITGAKSKEWVKALTPGPGGGRAGGALMSGAVVSADGGWWYVYFTTRFRAELPNLFITMARARLNGATPAPGSFFKYHDGRFDQPGLGGMESPVLSLESDSLNVADPHVIWSPALRQYVMTLDLVSWPELQNQVPLRRSGVAIAFSGDGLRWSKPTKLFTDYTVPRIGRSMSWEATVVLDRDDGLEGWLLYSYTPRFGSPPNNLPHYLVGRRLRFERHR
jgi:hypothetical protein